MTNNQKLFKYLDLTNLNVRAIRKDIKKLVVDAIKYQACGVCVQPGWVNFVKNRLKDTKIKTVVVPNWFVKGGLSTVSEETLDLCIEADEVDIIIDIYDMYILQKWDIVLHDFARSKKFKTVKLIIETNYINLAIQSGTLSNKDRLFNNVIDIAKKFNNIEWIKTDSGLFKRNNPETLYEDVKLIQKYWSGNIKASGGVHTAEQIEKLIDLGVGRIGISKYNSL